MPSRKKAKGQARKAAKVKNEAAEKAEKARKEDLLLFREFEQAQIQWLQINNALMNSDTCLHGFNPFANDDICIKFIRAFVHEFYEWHYKICRARGEPERAIIVPLSAAWDSMKDEYSEVWNSADKLKQVISYFLHNGAMFILDEKIDWAHNSAVLARFFEQWLKVEVHKSQAFMNWPKVVECGLVRRNKHTLVKYFWRRIRCCCLDKAYEEVKTMPKMGVCFNLLCCHRTSHVERSKLRYCSRCRGVTYCSRECQAADWSEHKEFCDKVAATRAEFDAYQKQQS
jgi:hypothetical protein